MPGNRKYDAVSERESNTVGRIIAKSRRDKGLSLAALSVLLRDYGVSATPPSISKWETGMTVPNAYQFNAVRSALEIEDPLGPEQTPELDDAGLTKLEEYKSDLIASGRYRPERGEREEIHYTEMPVSYLSVSAGSGEFLDEGGFETVAFPEHLIPAGAEFGVRVGGDSMEPVYKDGQIVWARRCNTLRFGDVGIFFYDGCGYLKAYSERDDGDGGRRPVLVSYNRKYEPIPVLPELEFRVFGRVLD